MEKYVILGYWPSHLGEHDGDVYFRHLTQVLTAFKPMPTRTDLAILGRGLKD